MYNGRYGSPGVKLASVHLDNFKVLQILPFLSEVCFPTPLSLPPPLSLFLFIINEIFHELSSLLALLTVRLFCLAKLSPSLYIDCTSLRVLNCTCVYIHVHVREGKQ